MQKKLFENFVLTASIEWSDSFPEYVTRNALIHQPNISTGLNLTDIGISANQMIFTDVSG